MTELNADRARAITARVIRRRNRMSEMVRQAEISSVAKEAERLERQARPLVVRLIVEAASKGKTCIGPLTCQTFFEHERGIAKEVVMDRIKEWLRSLGYSVRQYQYYSDFHPRLEIEWD